MPSTTTLRAITLGLLLLVPGLLRAGGSSEPVEPEVDTPGGPVTQRTVEAYWLLEAGAANAEMLLERFYLPTSLSVLRWTKFDVAAGAIELASTGGYRVARTEPILTEPWKHHVLRGYRIRVDFTAPADEPAADSRRFSVRFAYDVDRAGGEGATPQPLQQALLKGIEASGKRSGSARLLELRYEGKGRFTAQVEVR